MADQFWENYKRPEWQEKRLRIMERDGFKCRSCGDATTQLQVHHSYYDPGKKPWEYPDQSLKTLCKPCHENISGWLRLIRELLGWLDPSATADACGYVMGLCLLSGEISKAFIDNEKVLCGLSHALEITKEDVRASMDGKVFSLAEHSRPFTFVA